MIISPSLFGTLVLWLKASLHENCVNDKKFSHWRSHNELVWNPIICAVVVPDRYRKCACKRFHLRSRVNRPLKSIIFFQSMRIYFVLRLMVHIKLFALFGTFFKSIHLLCKPMYTENCSEIVNQYFQEIDGWFQSRLDLHSLPNSLRKY